jgi:hypothetical protein
MVDIKQWDRIQFIDIEEGDTILAERHNGISNTPDGFLEGEVQKKDRGWHISGWEISATALYDLRVYRKRPEFVLPTGIGAVISVEDKRGIVSHLVHADTNKDSMTWVDVADGDWYDEKEIMEDFVNHRVISEGVAL